MSSAPLRVGILGAGWAAARHAGGYRGAGAEIVAIAARDTERRRGLAERFAIPRCYDDPADLLARDDIDAVSVCVPNALHAKLTLAALDANKHVLCEKPPASTVAEAQAMAARAAERGRVLSYALQRRHAPATTALRTHLAAGGLGTVYHARAVWARTWGVPGGVGGWFVDPALGAGGALIDIGVHVLDLAWFLLGRPRVLTVSGQVHRRHGAAGGNDESAFALARFEGGASLELEASWVLPQERDRMAVHLHGTAGGARVDDGGVDLFGVGPGAATVKPELSGDDAFVAQARDFAAATLGATPSAGPRDGVALMRMLSAVYRSSREGREVVLEEWDDPLPPPTARA